MTTDGYIVISNYRVQPVTIIRRERGFLIVEFPGSAENTRIRVRESRFFKTAEAANEHIYKCRYEMPKSTNKDLPYLRKKEPCFYLQGI